MVDIGEFVGRVLGWIASLFVFGVSLWFIFQILKAMNKSLGFGDSSVGSRVVFAVYVVVLIVMVLAGNGN